MAWLRTDCRWFQAGLAVVVGFLVMPVLAGVAASAVDALPGNSVDATVGVDDADGGRVARHLTLDEIVVTDRALGAAGVSTIGVKSIEKGRNLNIPDVVRGAPDITLRRRAGIGDTSDNVSIRGLSGNRLTLNLNGRPVNAAGVVGGHYIDWGTIPLDNIAKIEILRGGSSVRYGRNALGGVINVITKSPTSEPTFTLYQGFGAGSDIDYLHNTRFTHSWKVGPVGYSLAGSYQKADEFLWNNDFEARNLSLFTEIDMVFDGVLTLGLQYADAERGFIRSNRQSSDPTNPGFHRPLNSDYPVSFGETFNPYSGTAFIPGPGAHWDKTKYYFDLGYRQPLGDATVRLHLYRNHEDRREKNYATGGLVPGYDNGELVLDRTVESDRSYGGLVEVLKPFGDHELLLGIDHQVLAYGAATLHYLDQVYNSHNWFGPPASGFKPSSEAVAWGYYLQDAWCITDRLLLTGGLRYDRYENRAINGSTLPDLSDARLTPKLTGTLQVSAVDTVTASVYQALRTPGLPETYWWGMGATGGSPELKPELNSAAELVWEHKLRDRGMLRLAAYYYRIEDYIMFRLDPNWRGVYNLEQAVIYGLSCDGRYEVQSGLTVRGAVSAQRSRKEGDPFDSAGLSDELDYLPRLKASIGADLRLPRRSLLSADLHYVGRREAIYSYSKGFGQAGFYLAELDAYATVDLSLRVPVGEHAEIGLYVENLLDTEYEEQFGYPLSGRFMGVSVKVSF